MSFFLWFSVSTEISLGPCWSRILLGFWLPLLVCTHPHSQLSFAKVLHYFNTLMFYVCVSVYVFNR